MNLAVAIEVRIDAALGDFTLSVAFITYDGDGSIRLIRHKTPTILQDQYRSGLCFFGPKA